MTMIFQNRIIGNIARTSETDADTFDLCIQVASSLATDPFPEVKKEVSNLVCSM